jgi:hypothetical protein
MLPVPAVCVRSACMCPISDDFTKHVIVLAACNDDCFYTIEQLQEFALLYST